MDTKDQKLIPQTEESIEIAEWTSLAQFLAEDRVVYNSIMDVLTCVQ